MTVSGQVGGGPGGCVGGPANFLHDSGARWPPGHYITAFDTMSFIDGKPFPAVSVGKKGSFCVKGASPTFLDASAFVSFSQHLQLMPGVQMPPLLKGNSFYQDGEWSKNARVKKDN